MPERLCFKGRSLTMLTNLPAVMNTGGHLHLEVDEELCPLGGAWSRSPHREEPAEVSHLSWGQWRCHWPPALLPLGGVWGNSCQEEAPAETQEWLGWPGKPWGPPGRAGGSVRGEGHLSVPALWPAPGKKKKMDGWRHENTAFGVKSQREEISF